MPIVTLNQTDPQGTLSPTKPTNNYGGNIGQILSTIAAVVKSKKQNDMNKQFRESAFKDLAGGASESEYEFDPATGQVKFKVAPKKDKSQSEQMKRFLLTQQFGVDPVTGQPADPSTLKKPRFGYQGNPLLAVLNDPSAMAGLFDDTTEEESSGSSVAHFGTPSAQAAPAATPQITMPSESGGKTNFLSDLEVQAQNAIKAGADPVKVKKRLAELQGASRGSV